MSNRAVASLFLVLALAATAAAQRGIALGSISGQLRSADDHGIADARVELKSEMTGAVISSTYTGINGAFEFRDVPNGIYEVVATSGLAQVNERATVHDDPITVALTLPVQRDRGADAGTRDTVSVAQMKVPEKARDAFKKAAKAMNKHDSAEAWKQVQHALEIEPQFAEALTLRALLQLDEDKSDPAMADLEAAIQADSSYPMAYLVLGAAYNSKGRFDDALRTLDRGISLAPTSWQAYFELGKAYLGKKELDSALKQVNKAADLAPADYGPVHLIRANIYLAQKNYGEAMSELEVFLEKEPNGPNSQAARKTLDQVKTFAAAK